MNNTLVITNQTATRIAVIGQRTDSALFAGAKAILIENLKQQMRNGVAHFLYIKKMAKCGKLGVPVILHLLLNTLMAMATQGNYFSRQPILILKNRLGAALDGNQSLKFFN